MPLSMNKVYRVIRRFFKNVHFLLHEDLYNNAKSLKKTEKELSDSRLLNQLMANSLIEKMDDYRQELAFIFQQGISVFPYHNTKKLDKVDAFFDDKLSLPYVLHKGKKLYFRASSSVETAANQYRNFIEVENILGGGYKEKMPHSYVSDSFAVHEGDIMLDIGAAEALFTLDNIDKISKAYVFESSESWNAPLHATFSPYKDKVIIINKIVTDNESSDSVTLESVLRDVSRSRLFVKMDVEGYEQQIVRSSLDFLSQAEELRIACCTYHKENDAAEIMALFDKYHLTYEFSDGYMLFVYDSLLKYPFFRKGMIRGWK